MKVERAAVSMLLVVLLCALLGIPTASMGDSMSDVAVRVTGGSGPPPTVTSTSISCGSSCGFNAGPAADIGTLTATMSDMSAFTGTFAEVNTGSVGSTPCYIDPSSYFLVSGNRLSVNTGAVAGTYNVCWSAIQGGSSVTNIATVAGVTGVSTWDPATLGTGLSLNSTNTVATNVRAGSTLAYSTRKSSPNTQNNYFELACTATGTNEGLGLQDNATQIAYLGVDQHSVGFYRTQYLVGGNAAGSGWAGCVNGDIAGISFNEAVSPPTVSVHVLHAGVWGATSGPYAMGTSMTQGTPLFISTALGDLNGATTICGNPGCAASPAGLPTGAVWFDGGSSPPPPTVTATSIICSPGPSCGFTAGTAGAIGTLSATMSDASSFTGSFALVASGSVGGTVCDHSGYFSVSGNSLSVAASGTNGTYNVCWSATQGASSVSNVAAVTGSGGAAPTVTATSISCSPACTFVAGSGGAIGTLSATMSNASTFTGTFAKVNTGAVGGTTCYTDPSSYFSVSGNSLNISASAVAGTYNVCWSATQGGSSLSNVVAVTGTAPGSDPTVGLLPSYDNSYANWKNAGTVLAGGIPAIEASYTQCGATVVPSGITPPASGDDASRINTALSACTAGHFVLLNGMFKIDVSQRGFSVPSGVVLRGSGTCNNPPPPFPQTVVNNTGYCPSGIVVINGMLPFTVFYSCGNPSNCSGQEACGVSTSSPGACPNGGPPVVFLGQSANGISGWAGCGPQSGNATGLSCGGVALAADAGQGATSVQLTATSAFSVGQYVLIDEDTAAQWTSVPTGGYDGWANVFASPEYLNSSGSPSVARLAWSKYANAGLTTFGGDLGNTPPGTAGTSGCYFAFCGRPTSEIHKITAIGSSCPGTGCTLTFDDPLMIGYRQSGGHNAQVYWPSISTDGGGSYHAIADNMAQFSGVENLSLLRGPSGGLLMRFCRFCWVTGTEAGEWEGGGMAVQDSIRSEFNNDLIQLCQWCTNNGGEYSFDISEAATEILFTNSITQYGGKGMVGRGGGAGSVISYNNFDKTHYWAGISEVWVEMAANASHWIGPHHVLFEGNFASTCDNDNTHGSTNYVTYYRNQCQGYRTAFTDPATGHTVDDQHNLPGSNGPFRAAAMMGTNYWSSFLGNVLGSAAFTTAGHGWTFSSTCGWCDWSIYLLGWNVGSLGGGPGPGGGADPYLNGVSGSYYYTHGNFDYYTADQNAGNGLIWNPGNSDHTLTNSFYLTSQPSFFGTQGSCTYPWPWVTPTGSPQVLANSCGGSGLPAKYRADQGSPLVTPGPPPPPTISGVTLSNGLGFFVPATANSTLSTISATCSAGSCAAATFALSTSSNAPGCASATSNGNFNIPAGSNNLNVGGSQITATGNYPIGIQVTVSGATNNGACYPLTLVAATPTSYFLPQTNVTLSNGTAPAFRTATNGSGTSNNDYQVWDVLHATGISGKTLYYEMGCAAVNGTAGGGGAGYANAHLAQPDWLGHDNNSAGYILGGGANNWQAGASYISGAWGGCATGDTMGLVLDATVTPMTLAVKVLHSGTWGALNTARAVPSGLTAAGTLIPTADVKATGEAYTICGNTGCAASPSGLPSGAVWFDTVGGP